MKQTHAQFHLAIAVFDLEVSRQFYRDVLGGEEGRSTDNLIDFNFYGHHLVLHIAPEQCARTSGTFESKFHDEKVTVPHFGLNFDRQTWSELAERIKSRNYPFVDPPHVRMAGKPGEHATLFIMDPSGNALEFKAFKNHDEVFSKIFDPKTRDLSSLEAEVAAAVYQT
ncbi:VOC family protein [Paraburkholderia hayleyella]|uniref:VOC family protein n=1 Tax=Paraburkholderia hayleyella TaxID=2152889 RepID=UPI0012927D04|nr:VOC family protein [Paraburkholderia hayleyella]